MKIIEKLYQPFYKKIAYTSIIGFCLILAVILICNKIEKNSLKNKGRIYSVFVTNFNVSNSKFGPKYILNVVFNDNNQHLTERTIRTNLNNLELLKNHYVPILIDSTDDNNYKFLLTKNDFNDFGITYPDSLNNLRLQE